MRGLQRRTIDKKENTKGTEEMKCMKCNHEIRENAVFCTNCGSNVEEMKKLQEEKLAGTAVGVPESAEELSRIIEKFVRSREAGYEGKIKENEKTIKELKEEVTKLKKEIHDLQDEVAEKEIECRRLRETAVARPKPAEEASEEIGAIGATGENGERVCSRCGNILEEDMRFCNRCGTKYEEA